jgi:hypothetical protein
MIDFILSGLKYGLLGGAAAVTFVLFCILTCPFIVLAGSFISAIFSIGHGGKNNG